MGCASIPSEMSVGIILCLVLASFKVAYSARLQCLNEQGKPVDWFVMYKIPIISKSSNPLIKKGYAYAYSTSDSSTSDWILSTTSINDSKSMTGRTLSPIYQDDVKDVLQILYNDEPPSSSAPMTYGHTKGVVMFNKEEGFWLIHSSPKFPIEAFTVSKDNSKGESPKKNSYFFPKTAAKFGQSFLCISLPGSEANAVGTQLKYNRPKIYSSTVPESLKDVFKNLSDVTSNKFIKSPPWYNSLTLKSTKGKKFVSYAKSGKFCKELYSDWVAPDLEADLNVETWSNGPGELPSNCKNQFKVMDVKQVSLAINGEVSTKFKNSGDHSKWAVSAWSNITVSCIGDINRMEAQLRRGGGTVCFQEERVWKLYSESVTELEPCPKNN